MQLIRDNNIVELYHLSMERGVSAATLFVRRLIV